MKLIYNRSVAEAMHSSASDTDAAAQLLLIVADYLKGNREMPWELRWHLANAFETAMNQPPDKRNSALLLALNLKSAGRRPVKTPLLNGPGEAFNRRIEAGESQNEAASQISVDFGISEATATRLWKAWSREKAADENMDQSLYERLEGDL